MLHVIASRPNICNQLHMPAQSGSTAVLERMRRGYSREAYDELVAHVRGVLPHVALSTDMIVGFCGGWCTAALQARPVLHAGLMQPACLLTRSD